MTDHETETARQPRYVDCPNVVDWGDGPELCHGTLEEVGIWRGEALLPGEPVYDGPDVWLWWTACDLCGWDETIGEVP